MNVTVRRVEEGLRDGDLVVGEIVHHVRAAEERIPQDDGVAGLHRGDAEAALAVRGHEAAVDEGEDGDGDDGAGEVEVHLFGRVDERAETHGEIGRGAVGDVVVTQGGIERIGDVGRQFGVGRARVEEYGEERIDGPSCRPAWGSIFGHGDCVEIDSELGVRSRLAVGYDWEGGEWIDVLGAVDTTKKNGAGVCVHVIQPQTVGGYLNEALLDQSQGYVIVYGQVDFVGDLCFVAAIANAHEVLVRCGTRGDSDL